MISGGNLYKNNSAQFNNKQGFYLQSDSTVLLNNTAINNNGKGGSVDIELAFSGSPQVFNNFAGSYSSGVPLLVVSSTSVTSSTGYWTNVSA